MKIKSKEFCYLSTSPSFLRWLDDNSRQLYLELSKHHETNDSCAENKKIMYGILKEITKDKSLAKNLVLFLQSNYPYIIESDSSPSKTIRGDDSTIVSKVFGLFDPSILTFPRRAVVDDLAVFISDKPIYDYVEVDGKFHVEYLIGNDQKLYESIPESNWLTRQYKKSNIL